MSNQNKIAPINLVKASAWAAHHEYMKELKRKPKERKTGAGYPDRETKSKEEK